MEYCERQGLDGGGSVMIANEKAAQGVSSTPAASKKHYACIVASAAINDKTFTALQANFALLGHALNRSHSADDGRCTFIVARWGQALYFTQLNDVAALLTQIGGPNA